MTGPLRPPMFQSRPVLLVGVGLGLVLLAAGLWLVLKPEPIPVPPALAGLPLSTQATGPAALAEIERLHGRRFLLAGGAVARYNGGNITVWVSSAWLPFLAARQVAAMTNRIAQTDSPFTPGAPQNIAGHTVYPLTGMGQMHFYFQHGRLVIWLAAPPSLARQSLTDYINNLP